jgi:hypothetical protein
MTTGLTSTAPILICLFAFTVASAAHMIVGKRKNCPLFFCGFSYGVYLNDCTGSPPEIMPIKKCGEIPLRALASAVEDTGAKMVGSRVPNKVDFRRLSVSMRKVLAPTSVALLLSCTTLPMPSDIAPIAKTVLVSDADDPEQASLVMQVRDTTGRERYDVRCHSSDYEGDNLNYSGLIECKVFNVANGPSFDNVVHGQEYQKTVTSRGRFFSEHLRAGCAQNRDWGAVRTFSLPDMKLSINVSQVTFASTGSVASYRLRVSAVPSAATSSRGVARLSRKPTWFDEPAPC